MLVLKRKNGDWTEFTNEKNGDTIRFRVYDIRGGRNPQVSIACDDPTKLYSIKRPERVEKPINAI